MTLACPSSARTNISRLATTFKHKRRLESDGQRRLGPKPSLKGLLDTYRSSQKVWIKATRENTRYQCGATSARVSRDMRPPFSMISTQKLYAAQAKLSVMQQITNLSFVLAVYDGRMTSAAPNAQRQSARSASTGIPGHHCSRKPNAVLEARDG